MPRRSKIDALPVRQRDAIRRFIQESGFANYRETADAIEQKFGVKLSRSALTRYGSKFEHRIELLRAATAEGRAVIEEMGEKDAAPIGESLIRLAQSRIFDALLKVTAETICKPDLTMLAKTAGELERIALSQQRRADRAEAKLRKATEVANRELAHAVSGANAADDPHGIARPTIEKIRAALLGDSPSPARGDG